MKYYKLKKLIHWVIETYFIMHIFKLTIQLLTDWSCFINYNYVINDKNFIFFNNFVNTFQYLNY